MPTLAVHTGFEFGTSAGITTGNSGWTIAEIFDGGNSIQSGGGHTGTYFLRQARSAAACRFAWTTSTVATSAHIVMRAWVRVNSGSGTAGLMHCDTSTGNDAGIRWNASTSKFEAGIDGNTFQVTPGTYATATWHLLEFYINRSANPWVVKWRVNGVDMTDATANIAATTSDWVFLGKNANETVNADFDDVAVSRTAADYPLGDGKGVILTVDPTGTVSATDGGTDFRAFTNNGTIAGSWNATNVRNAVTELPPTIGATASGMVQITTDTTNYVNLPMTTYALGVHEVINGARMLACGWAADATAATISLRSYNGTTETVLFATADPNFSNSTSIPAWVCGMLTTADINTQAELDALVMRVGRSGDAAPDIGIHAIYVEVDIAVPPPQTIAEDPSAPAPVTDTDNAATTASFTPVADCLIVAVAICGNITGTGTLTAPVTDSLGSTWTLLERSNAAGTGCVEVWAMDAGSSPSARTVTVTGTGGAQAVGVALTVKCLTGANPVASCLGATAETAGTNAYTISHTSTTTDALVIGGVVNNINAGALTPNSVTHPWQAVSDTTQTERYGVWRAIDLVATPGTEVFGYTQAAGQQQAHVAVEILPAGGPTAVDVNASDAANAHTAHDATVNIVSDIIDNFDDNSIAAHWTNNGGSNITETGQQLRLETDTGAFVYFNIVYNAGPLTLTGRYLGTTVVDAGNQALLGYGAYPIALTFTTNNEAYWVIVAGTAYAYTNVGGAFTQRGSGVAHTNGRTYVVGENSGDLVWAWSDDGIAWTATATVANPYSGDVTVTPYIMVGTDQANGSTTTMVVDDFRWYDISAGVNADAETTSHSVVAANPTPAVGSPTTTATNTHQAGQPTTTTTTTASAGAHTHQAETATTRIATTDTTAPANTHLTNAPVANVGGTDQTAPAHTHTTHPPTTTATTAAGTAGNGHQAEQPTATLTTTDSTAPTIGHTAHDATVSTVAMVNADAGETTLTHTTADPAPAVAITAGTTSTSHNAPDAPPGLALPAGTTTHSQTAGNALGAIAAPTSGGSHTHDTGTPAPGLSVGAIDAPISHTAYDATVSTNNAVDVDAGTATIGHTTHDATVVTGVDVFAGYADIGLIAHIPIGGITQAFNAEHAAITHQVGQAVAGVGKTSQDATHALTAGDVRSTQTTRSGPASVALVAFNASVTTIDYIPAYVGIDAGSAWANNLDPSRGGVSGPDQLTHSTGQHDNTARATLVDTDSVASGNVG